MVEKCDTGDGKSTLRVRSGMTKLDLGGRSLDVTDEMFASAMAKMRSGSTQEKGNVQWPRMQRVKRSPLRAGGGPDAAQLRRKALDSEGPQRSGTEVERRERVCCLYSPPPQAPALFHRPVSFFFYVVRSRRLFLGPLILLDPLATRPWTVQSLRPRPSTPSLARSFSMARQAYVLSIPVLVACRVELIIVSAVPYEGVCNVPYSPQQHRPDTHSKHPTANC